MPESSAAESLVTARLRLDPLAAADLADVHAIYADPGTWRHLPSGRHTALAQAERMLEESEQSWAASGLGRWTIRLRSDLPGTALSGTALTGTALSGTALTGTALPGTALPGTALAAGSIIGVASATLMECGARNFGYRLTPASWGVGLATEAATAALGAARDSEFPVTARALTANPASVRVLERIGLTRVWSGHELPGTGPERALSADAHTAAAPAQPDSTALERVIFADRPLAGELLAAIISLG